MGVDFGVLTRPREASQQLPQVGAFNRNLDQASAVARRGVQLDDFHTYCSKRAQDTGQVYAGSGSGGSTEQTFHASHPLRMYCKRLAGNVAATAETATTGADVKLC